MCVRSSGRSRPGQADPGLAAPRLIPSGISAPVSRTVPGVEDARRVERVLDPPHQRHRDRIGQLQEVAHLRGADAALAADRAAAGPRGREDLPHHLAAGGVVGLEQREVRVYERVTSPNERGLYDALAGQGAVVRWAYPVSRPYRVAGRRRPMPGRAAHACLCQSGRFLPTVTARSRATRDIRGYVRLLERRRPSRKRRPRAIRPRRPARQRRGHHRELALAGVGAWPLRLLNQPEAAGRGPSIARPPGTGLPSAL